MTHLENQHSSILNRFFLRFVFLYLVFYIYPYGFEYIQELDTNDISIWENITIWFGEGFLGWEMDKERLMKGFDSKYDYSRFLLITLLALLGTGIWMFVDSKTKSDYNSKLKTLTRTILRYHVGLTLIIYGISKVFMLQFGEMDLDKLESTVGSNNGMRFLWTFMSYSKFYTMSTGWIEVIGGVLLLFRRTTFIGTFILFISMVNVVLIDIGYDVRVKMFAIHLLLMTILLMSNDLKRITNFFFFNKPTKPSIELALFSSGIYKKIGYALKGALLLYFTVSCFFIYKDRIHKHKENRYPSLTSFHEVQTQIINGERIPETDERRWKSISINGNSYRPESLRISSKDSYPKYYSFTADTIQKTISLVSKNHPDLYEFTYKELPDKVFIFEGASSQGDSIWIKTKSKSLKDYPLTSNKIKWITDLK